MIRRSPLRGPIVLWALVAFLAVVAAVLLWSTFMVYDDEGYVLYSLKAFAEHGSLYDDVYSQYGPFFFVLYRGLHALGFEFTNSAARLVTLGCWLGTVLLCGAVVWRETRRNVLATAAALTGVFIQLWSMVAEPSHPGGLIALLVAAAAWCGTNQRWTAGVRAAAVGAIIAMLALTKVNTGVFLFASAGAWWALNLSVSRHSRWIRVVIAAGLALLPMVVMAGLLNEPWVRMFAGVIAAGSVCLVLSWDEAARMPSGWKELAIGSAAAVAISAVTLTITMLSGTTPAELVEGVLLGPLRHPAVYAGPFTWRAGSLLLAIAAIPACAWLKRQPRTRSAPVILTGRLLLVAGYAACATGLFPLGVQPYVLAYGIAAAWLFVLPVGDDEATRPTRTWLALVVVMQAMHAYPVAGSQLSWGTFLWIPLAAVAVHDAATWVTSPVTRRIAAAAVAVLTFGVCARYAEIAVQRRSGGEDLEVPGAESIRLPASFASGVRMLVSNSQVHADVLFSLPGMMSFNLWTGIAPPTRTNATHWFNLLTEEQQAEIQRRLERTPRSAVILQRNLYEFIEERGIISPTPLLRWMKANYVPAFTAESYEFWVRKGRTIAPVNSARLLVGAPGAPVKYKIEIVIAPPAPVTVASIELRQYVDDTSHSAGSWTNQDARFIATSISLEGNTSGEPAERKLPFEISGVQRINAFTNTLPAGFDSRKGVLWLRDGRGRRVGEARFID